MNLRVMDTLEMSICQLFRDFSLLLMSKLLEEGSPDLVSIIECSTAFSCMAR